MTAPHPISNIDVSNPGDLTASCPRISIVIPTLNAGPGLATLLERLAAQKPGPPDEIVMIDSGSTDETERIARACPSVRWIPIQRFSHGGARNLGARESRGDFVVLMTQDAIPANTAWLERLLAPLADPKVAAVCSRQIPRADAPPTEQFFLAYHFPPGRPVRRSKPANREPTLEDVFFSNVSAGMRRSILLRYPFDETLIMSEDQQFAKDVINAGFDVVYQPESVVTHSHRYSLSTAFRRYFDSVYSLTVIFPRHDVQTTAAMGRRYLRQEILYMVRHHPWYLPYYGLYNLAKASGTLAAHVADRLPPWLLRRLSLHRYHWES